MLKLLLNTPQLYIYYIYINAFTIYINAFNNWNTHYNDNFQNCDTVKLLSKSINGLQKINKTNKKDFAGRPTSLNLCNRSVSEHIKHAHFTQFPPPKNQNYQSWWTHTRS